MHGETVQYTLCKLIQARPSYFICFRFPLNILPQNIHKEVHFYEMLAFKRGNHFHPLNSTGNYMHRGLW